MFHQFVPLAHYIHYRSLHSLAYRLILPVPTHRVETLWPEGSRDREGEGTSEYGNVVDVGVSERTSGEWRGCGVERNRPGGNREGFVVDGTSPRVARGRDRNVQTPG